MAGTITRQQTLVENFSIGALHAVQELEDILRGLDVTDSRAAIGLRAHIVRTMLGLGRSIDARDLA